MIHNQSKKFNWLCDKVFVGAAPVGESLILEFLKKAPAAEFREVENIDSEIVKVRRFLRHGAWRNCLQLGRSQRRISWLALVERSSQTRRWRCFFPHSKNLKDCSGFVSCECPPVTLFVSQGKKGKTTLFVDMHTSAMIRDNFIFIIIRRWSTLTVGRLCQLEWEGKFASKDHRSTWQWSWWRIWWQK